MLERLALAYPRARAGVPVGVPPTRASCTASMRARWRLTQDLPKRSTQKLTRVLTRAPITVGVGLSAISIPLDLISLTQIPSMHMSRGMLNFPRARITAQRGPIEV